MATRAEVEKATVAKKGVARKRAKKLAQRKPLKTNRPLQKVEAKSPRTKRDTTAVIAHEAEASTSKARATRTVTKTKKVRASR